jgi:hypothetical protein
MGHKVTVNSTNKNVTLPNGFTYAAGQTVVLSDDQFARLNPASLTDGTLSDGGAYPPVQGFTVNSDEQLLNGSPVQAVGGAPARVNLRREDTIVATTQPVTGNLIIVPVATYAGDVISTVTAIPSAAITPTYSWVVLYNSAGTAVAVSASKVTTSVAGTPYTWTLSTPYAVAATGFTYVGVTSVASLLLYGVIPTIATILLPAVPRGGAATLSQASVGAGLTTAPANAAAATAIASLAGITAAAAIPYLVLA